MLFAEALTVPRATVPGRALSISEVLEERAELLERGKPLASSTPDDVGVLRLSPPKVPPHIAALFVPRNPYANLPTVIAAQLAPRTAPVKGLSPVASPAPVAPPRPAAPARPVAAPPKSAAPVTPPRPAAPAPAPMRPVAAAPSAAPVAWYRRKAFGPVSYGLLVGLAVGVAAWWWYRKRRG